MSIKYQVHIIHLPAKGGRNVFDKWCDSPHAAEAEKRRHFRDMRGKDTRVAIEIRKVEIDDEIVEAVDEAGLKEQRDEIAKAYPVSETPA